MAAEVVARIRVDPHDRSRQRELGATMRQAERDRELRADRNLGRGLRRLDVDAALGDVGRVGIGHAVEAADASTDVKRHAFLPRDPRVLHPYSLTVKICTGPCNRTTLPRRQPNEFMYLSLADR